MGGLKMLNKDILKTKREFKGLSCLQLLDDYVVLDFETTGLDPEWNDIIEVAALKVINGIIIKKYTTLVNPDYEIDEFITELTGITNDMLLNAPDIKNVLPELLEFVGDSIVIAHNANYDINFLYDKCMNELDIPFKNDFIDTLRISRRLFKDFENHKLSTLVKNFNIEIDSLHRSLSDSVAAYKIYEYMKKYSKANNIDLESLSKKHSYNIKAKDINTQNASFDEFNPLFNKNCVFTGKLERMTRKEAMQIVVDFGGTCSDSINKNVNLLILGNNDFCSSIKDGKSTKQKKAEQYILDGHDLVIVSENVFYDMIET